jgi:hypothetical protein
VPTVFDLFDKQIFNPAGKAGAREPDLSGEPVATPASLAVVGFLSI